MPNVSTGGISAHLAAIAATVLCATAAIAQDIPPQKLSQELHDMLPERIRSSGVVNVAGSFDNPPGLYADIASADRPLGVAPDLSKAIGEILGVEFQWRNTQWPGQLPGLDAGTFDAVWGQISVTAQREREVLDIIPWAEHTLAFLVQTGNPSGISDWATACGHSVGVSLGSIFVKTLTDASAKYCAAAGKPAIEIREFQGNEEPAVRSGQIDAVIDSSSVLTRMAENLPDVFEAVVMPEDQSKEFYPGLGGIGIKKENAGLATAMAAALKILHENGTWTIIGERNKSVREIPGIELVKVNALTGTPAGEVVKQ